VIGEGSTMSSKIENYGGRFIDHDRTRCCPDYRHDAVAEKSAPPSFCRCDQAMCGCDAPGVEVG